MQAIEFTATVQNGMIEIPQEYRSTVRDQVRVIVMKKERQYSYERENLIKELMKNPFDLGKNFKPMKRDEIYDRTKR